MLKRADIIQYVRDALADNGAQVTPAELDALITATALEYSRWRPVYADVALTTTAGTLRYALPANSFGILSAADATGAAVTVSQTDQVVVFTTDPGAGAITLTVSQAHVTDTNGDFPTIPFWHLVPFASLVYADLLDRLADDILRRPDVRNGQTSEIWNSSGRELHRAASGRRQAAYEALYDGAPFVG